MILFFGVTAIVKYSNKQKWVYSGYGKDEWSFGNDSVRDFVMFGFDNSSSSHADNCKSNFLILGECPALGINESFVSPEKKFSIYFSKAKTKSCLSLRYHVDNSYLFVNAKEIFKLKDNNENVNFSTRFYLASISDGFHFTDSREVFLGENVYNFSVDYNAIDKSDILNIPKYLMVKYDIK